MDKNQGLVYFIKENGTGAIKIGVSTYKSFKTLKAVNGGDFNFENSRNLL